MGGLSWVNAKSKLGQLHALTQVFGCARKSIEQFSIKIDQATVKEA